MNFFKALATAANQASQNQQQTKPSTPPRTPSTRIRYTSFSALADSKQMASPANSPGKKTTPTPARNSLRHRFGSFGRGTGKQLLQPLPGEKAATTLRVRVIGCKDIIAADSNGKSDPYVVLRFASQKFKTPVIKKTLNPVYDEKDATFNVPVYLSIVERIGATVELVLWDKDFIGKDYLGEVSLPLNQWFELNGGVRNYEDKKNTTFSMDLQSSKSKQDAKGTIQLKIGLARPAGFTGTFDFDDVYTTLVQRGQASRQNFFAAGIPTRGIGTVTHKGVVRFGAEAHSPTSPRGRTFSTTSSKSASSTLAEHEGKSSFRINWEGIKLDYSFAWGSDVRGVIMLDIKSASNLPQSMNGKDSADMDPFVAITYDGCPYRTRVIRNELNPEWSERIILYDREIPGRRTAKKIKFSVMDWERLNSDAHVGDASLDLSELMGFIPTQDPVTGLFPEGNHDRSLRTFKIPLIPDEGVTYDTKPVLEIRAYYDPHDWLRQRYWRSHLQEHDADGSNTFSRSELVALLKSVDLPVTPEQLDRLFTRHGKNPATDDLTQEETLISLQGWYGNFQRLTPSTAEDDKFMDEEEVQSPSDISSVNTKVSDEQDAPKEKDVTDPDTSSDSISTEVGGEPIPRPRPSEGAANRPRESIYELESQLTELFASHPDAQTTPTGEYEVPITAIVPIIRALSEQRGVVLLQPTEEVEFETLAAGNPGLNVTPTMVMGFISQIADHPAAAQSSPPPAADVQIAVESATPVTPPTRTLSTESPPRGRSPERNSPVERGSRASSKDSVQTSVYRPDLTRGLSTPSTPANSGFIINNGSPFDARTRAAPLEQVPPSSFKPAAPFRRRKSDASSRGMSDSETSPSASGFGDRGPRHRTPSNPTSPGSQSFSAYPFPGSRKGASPTPHHGPSQSTPSLPSQFTGGNALHGAQPSGGSTTPPSSVPSSMVSSIADKRDVDYDDQDENEHSGLFDPANLKASDLDTDESESEREDPDKRLGSSFARSSNSSLASMSSPEDRLEAIQKSNAELGRKLKESGNLLQQRMAEHDAEVDELQNRLEETRSQLQAAKREEKELRSKEKTSAVQFASLEAELAKVQRSLEQSRTVYQSLQKQYQEQCAESEKYRNSLRRRDQDIKDREEYNLITQSERDKWKATSEVQEAKLNALETELATSRLAQQQLDEQKQENLYLKETIDRLRFELDELRAALAVALGSGPNSAGPASAPGTLSKSLANELKARLDAEQPAESDGAKAGGDDEVMETVITTSRRRRVGGRSDQELVRIEDEVREYADEGTQADAPVPVPPPQAESSKAAELEAETARLAAGLEAKRKLASSSHDDEPPAYAQLLNEEQRNQIATETLAKWHHGRHAAQAVPQGISVDAVEGYNNLKNQLGYGCGILEGAVQASPITEPKGESASTSRQPVEEAPEKRGDDRNLFKRWLPWDWEDKSLWYMNWALLISSGILTVVVMTMIVRSMGRSVDGTFGIPRHDRRYFHAYNRHSGPGLEGFTTWRRNHPVWSWINALFGVENRPRVPT